MCLLKKFNEELYVKQLGPYMEKSEDHASLPNVITIIIILALITLLSWLLVY